MTAAVALFYSERCGLPPADFIALQSVSYGDLQLLALVMLLTDTDITLPELGALNVADMEEATEETGAYGLRVHVLREGVERPIRLTSDPWNAILDWLETSGRFGKWSGYTYVDEPIFGAEYQVCGVSGRTRLSVAMLTQILSQAAARVNVGVRPWLARGLEAESSSPPGCAPPNT